MLNRLLQDHSQFPSNDLQPTLNHEALAIFLKHSPIKTKNEQTFLLAGSEDLRVLLPRLKLNEEGEEAFILLRPYIHCIALYLRREQGELICFLFESQNWGTRYYPTRNFIDVLAQSFPDIKIILSGTEVQSQGVQRGCAYYSLAVLEYCVANGSQLLKQIIPFAQIELGDRYHHALQLTEDALPEDLFDKEVMGDIYNKKHHHISEQLEDLLRKNYARGDQLDWAKINAVVAEMQGVSLPVIENNLDYSPFYKINVDRNHKKITIRFDNKDHFLYGNFLIFSQEIYPGCVALRSNTLVLLQDNNPDISIQCDETNHSITYSSKNFVTLEKAFTELVNDQSALFLQHMRQQLALQEFSKSVQEEIELDQVKTNGVGGFDQRQVQFALTHLLKNNKKVYVPSLGELLGHETSLPLEGLKKNGYQHVVFSLNVGTQHQVGININLNLHSVSVYDSLSSTLSDNTKKRLKTLIGDDIDDSKILPVKTAYCQKDDWSCGVCVIVNLLHSVELKDDEPKKKLELEALARLYYRAYKVQEQKEIELLQQAESNDRYKRILLELVEAAKTSAAALNPLADFLQLELWGNLDRNATDRLNQNNEYQRTRSFSAALSEYRHLHPSDVLGCLLLQASCWYQKENLATFSDAIKSILVKTNQLPQLVSLSSNNKKILEAIDVEIGLILTTDENKQSDYEQQNAFLQKMLTFLLSGKDVQSSLLMFLSFVGISEYVAAITLKQTEIYATFYCSLLNKIFSRLSSLSELVQGANKQIKVEQQRREAIQNDKIKEVQSILRQVCPGDIDTKLCTQLTNHRMAYRFVTRYVNQTYFAGVDTDSVRKFLHDLLNQKESITPCNVIDAIKLYPGKNAAELITHYYTQTKWFESLSYRLRSMDESQSLTSESFQEFIAAIEILSIIPEFAIDFTLEYLNDSNITQQELCKDNRIETIFSKLKFASEDCKFEFNKKWLESYGGIHCQDLLFGIFKETPQAKRLELAERCQSKLYKYLFARLIQYIPIQDHSRFIEICKNSVSDACDLGTIIIELPERDRLQFARNCRHQIKKISDLASIIQVLTQAEGVTFARECSDQIISGEHLNKILYVLPQEVRLIFALDCIDRITNGSELAFILLRLPEDQRLLLAMKCIDCIVTAGELNKVLQWLPENSKLEFARKFLAKNEGMSPPSSKILKNLAKVMPGADLVKMCNALPAIDRYELAKDCIHRILDVRDLIEIIKLLPTANQLSFANQCEQKIVSGGVIIDVCKTLTAEDRLNFAYLCLPVMRGCNQIAEVLALLPEKERLDFANKAKPHITTCTGLAQIIRELNYTDRLKFAISCKEHIIDHTGLDCVIYQMHSEERLGGALTLKDQIHSIDALLLILNVLPQKAALDFATSCKEKIPNGYRLASVIDLIEVEKRLSLVSICMDKITKNREATAIIKLLPECDRLAFALAWRKKTSSDILSKELSESDQIKFIKEHEKNNFEPFGGEIISTLRAALSHVGIWSKRSHEQMEKDQLSESDERNNKISRINS